MIRQSLAFKIAWNIGMVPGPLYWQHIVDLRSTLPCIYQYYVVLVDKAGYFMYKLICANQDCFLVVHVIIALN